MTLFSTMQSAANQARPGNKMPACFVGPCLSKVHGAMSRIDDLVAGLSAFLKSTCVADEEVEISMPNGYREFVTVHCPATGMLLILSLECTSLTYVHLFA